MDRRCEAISHRPILTRCRRPLVLAPPFGGSAVSVLIPLRHRRNCRLRLLVLDVLMRHLVVAVGW